jgi:Mrp family chromosome partitioning ATPase
MSTTNRAFIKAYRQDAADTSPTGGATPSILSQAGAPSREAARTTNVSSQVGAIVDRPTGTQKRPLSSFIDAKTSLADTGLGTGSSTRTHTPSAQPSPSGRGSVKDSANFIEPGTTVASFQWPKICRTLSVQSAPQLDRVVDLLRAQADAGHSLAGVMGLFPRVGTTTTAVCLAARAARRVRRAVLLDANLRHPRIAAWLDAVPTVGWEEVLKHSSPLSDAVIRSTDDNLDLVALGAKAAKDPQRLAGGLQAAVTAGVLRHAYDLVFIDLGTFFDPASQPIVLELVRNMGIDCVIGVAGTEPADPRDLATITEHLEPTGCQFLGTIENRVATRS